ncbi:patatin-like phospholipase family protein [Kaarinaea lacus]
MSDTAILHRPKLGLALAGGGFRATLFHLGVLRRLAELDLLRYVEVLSTVSGGSIIGALYVLHLKHALTEKAQLTSSDYVEILKQVEQTLVKGVQKNLRTRLFMNPLGLLRVMLTSDTLGRRMARIYERYIFQEIVKKIQQDKFADDKNKGIANKEETWFIKLYRQWIMPGRLALRDLRIYPGHQSVTGGFEAYNKDQVKRRSRGSVITHLIMNATTLNSGTPFWFSSVEIGDPRLGFFRYAEAVTKLQKRRHLFYSYRIDELQAILSSSSGAQIPLGSNTFRRESVELAIWYRLYRQGTGLIKAPDTWKTLFTTFAKYKFPGRLVEAEFGMLRRMKLAAWYILKGSQKRHPITGGLSTTQHLLRFWSSFRQVDRELFERIEPAVMQDQTLQQELLSFVLELYYLRSAEVMSVSIEKDWKKLRVGEAVGASACFPPVFPPFEMLGIYDDAHVTRLGLTDGGVYDNMGLAALVDANCTHIIASDSSGLFDINQRVATGRVGMTGRILNILMDDIANQQRLRLRDRRRVSNAIDQLAQPPRAIKELRDAYDLRGLAYFHIQSPFLEDSRVSKHTDSHLVAALRTDLDGFGDVEINTLVNHGYTMADQYVRKFLISDPVFGNPNWNPVTKLPRPLFGWKSTEINKILKVGKSRFFRSLMLHVPVSWIFTTLVSAGLIWLVWDIKASPREILNRGFDFILTWFESTMPWFGISWTEREIPIGLLILIALLALVVVKALPKLSQYLRTRWWRGYRAYLSVSKLMRSFRGNILWFFGWFPVLFSIIVAVFATLNHVFYYLPFKWYTRNKS